MSEATQFVVDYFNLGPWTWMTKYQSKIPPGVTAESFFNVICSRGLEFKFCDPPDWTGNMLKDRPCYLIAEEDGRYGIYTNDMGQIIQDNVFDTLHEAIYYKAEMLLSMLSIAPISG